MSNRQEFVMLALQPDSNVRELCRRFEISPKTAYKWIGRYRASGEAGFQERSRRPAHSPHRSPAALEDAVLALHGAYPSWGARKLQRLLPAELPVPHPSTIAAILRRHGCPLLPALENQQKAALTRFEHEIPNALWQMDFKGHFALLDSRAGRCHPLTLLDDHSRYALCLQACGNELGATVQGHLIEVFRRYGLPGRITADNGPPWGSTNRGGLSALEIWLMRLGIRVSHSRPYHPQTQGKLERFHQTLKRELLQRSGFSSLVQCQDEMNRWRIQYNQVRPHQALDQKPPLSRYSASPIAYPEQLPDVVYDQGERVLKVKTKGQIGIKGQLVFVSEGLAGQPVAIRPTAIDGVFDIVFIYKTVRQIDLNQTR